MINLAEVNYQPLNSYATVYHIFKWVKRGVMIVVRIALLFFLFLLYKKLTLGDGFAVDLTINGNFNIGFIVDPVFWIGLWMVSNLPLIIGMSVSLQKFVAANKGLSMAQMSWSAKARPGSAFNHMQVPSFKGHPMRISLSPIIGQSAMGQFGLFARHYKEGGIIRWRERQMDTIVWYDLPISLPYIVINARGNERARKSNMTVAPNNATKFQFEGLHGANYDVYAEDNDHITALQLFTPDVLDVLFTQLPNVDIVIKDKTVWFVWRYKVLNSSTARQLMIGSQQVLEQLKKQMQSL